MTSFSLVRIVKGKDNISDGLKLELKIRSIFHNSKMKVSRIVIGFNEGKVECIGKG